MWKLYTTKIIKVSSKTKPQNFNDADDK